jgi:transcription elongation factor Elf1
MFDRISNNICPLCGSEANFMENEITLVNCKRCGNYTYHISVHPLLFENEYRNPVILKMLSNKVENAVKDGNSFEINFSIYQELEKKLL